MSLTLDEANRILRGALAKAQELNIKVSAAVCDAGGRPIALQRMDGAIWASAYGSQGKAVASAALGRPRAASPPPLAAR
jgi:glc operon protein GlcG